MGDYHVWRFILETLNGVVVYIRLQGRRARLILIGLFGVGLIGTAIFGWDRTPHQLHQLVVVTAINVVGQTMLIAVFGWNPGKPRRRKRHAR
ncbi:hypothetical protein [Sulfobacillus harzensis]|uniref:Uncharacterized protein n=1 Tax=Sulfobacillus harzensis TaxID=2729629 RepID=A0A7Y0Q4G2_9FIRM|nr:hypothetical protein [Sulfobacillus harzensis]NMP24380.1 hypothetical protein [Sulfobacillus harzensis]